MREWAFPGTEVDVISATAGPESIESVYEEYLSIKPTAEKLMEVEAMSYDAAIVGCFGDPGLDGLREVSRMPVFGPARSSVATALTIGHRFSIVTVVDSIVPALRRLVWEIGALEALASIRYIQVAVLDLEKDRDAAVRAMTEQGSLAVSQDGADVLVLGCMSMGFLDVAPRISREIGVPVVNPAHAGLKVTEASVAMGLRHSPRVYMMPPRVRAGKSVADLYLSEQRD